MLYMPSQEEEMISRIIRLNAKGSKYYAQGIQLALSSLVKDEVNGWTEFAKRLVLDHLKERKSLDGIVVNRLILDIASAVCRIYMKEISEESEDTIYAKEIM